ncbi:ribosome-associated protein [Corynebacterium renale]|uniref:Ribosome-associated protein YbcJ (S4-like RNA binding protein) n=2 Tax=Corynebacterium renale TaxID=1724 RepID=A0A2A9DLS7_9CORY|nr:ribosome-associated protein YbcJ (S4-like RNA binding protein) [Corynebacterium renale]SQG63761.1 ribosome-associated protein [Corynebacterium renale]SQI23132.1 ribosome-associated protein [Corynebacterium renale]
MSMQEFEVPVSGTIKLGQFIKLASLAETGGHAKELIAEGHVQVNGEVVTARGHVLHDGDVVSIPGVRATVTADDGEPEFDDDFDPEKWRNM